MFLGLLRAWNSYHLAPCYFTIARRHGALLPEPACFSGTGAQPAAGAWAAPDDEPHRQAATFKKAPRRGRRAIPKSYV